MTCKLAELNWKIPCFREQEKEKTSLIVLWIITQHFLTVTCHRPSSQRCSKESSDWCLKSKFKKWK